MLDGVSNASNVIASSSEALYRIFCSSKTEMVYHYFYNSPSWKLVGTSSTVAFMKTDFFAGSVNGKLVHSTNGPISWSSRSGGIWYNYVEAYVDAKSNNPNFHKIDRLGTFTIRGFNQTFQYAPRFFDYPGYIG